MMENFASADEVFTVESKSRLNAVIDRISNVPCHHLDRRNDDSKQYASTIIQCLRFALLGCGFHKSGTECLRRLVNLESCVDSKLILKYSIKMKNVVCIKTAIMDAINENEQIDLPDVQEVNSNSRNAILREHVQIIKTKFESYCQALKRSKKVLHSNLNCCQAYENLITGLLALSATSFMGNFQQTLLEFIEMNETSLSFDYKNLDRSLANWGLFRGICTSMTVVCSPILIMPGLSDQINTVVDGLHSSSNASTH